MNTVVPLNKLDTLINYRFLLNDTFRHNEGIQLEFKKSFHTNQYQKYRETICAFLNSYGGHMIFGVLNDCTIKGFKLTNTEKDNILLFVDSLHCILKKENGEQIHNDTIKVHTEEIAKDIYIIIISCYNEPNTKYQFLSGESWERLHASNKRINMGKLYSAIDVNKIKIKMDNKIKEEVNNTIIFVGNILEKKYAKEIELQKNKYILHAQKINMIIILSYLFIIVIFYYKILNIFF